MNVDRGKSEFSLEERRELAAKLREYKSINGYSWGRVGQKVGLAESTLSVIGGPNSDLTKYSNDKFAHLNKFFLTNEVDQELEKEAAIVPGFQMTKTARQIHAICDWSRRGKMNIVVGSPGVGKTGAIDQYRVMRAPHCWKMTASPSSKSLNGMLLSVLASTGAIREGGSSNAISKLIRERVGGKQGVLIVDEAQHLGDAALEELRNIYDETGVGIVFAGNREVLTRVEGARRDANFAQFFRRIGMVHNFEVPYQEGDVDVLLNAWKVSHPRERALCTKIAMKAGGGAIGQMSNVLELATIIAQRTHEDRAYDHIEDAAIQLRAQKAA